MTIAYLILVLYVLGYLIALGILLQRNRVYSFGDLFPLLLIALLSWVAVGMGLAEN